MQTNRKCGVSAAVQDENDVRMNGGWRKFQYT